MPRNITYTVVLYSDDNHSQIMFRRKYKDVDNLCKSFIGIPKSFIYNIFKSKPKKIGRVTQEKMERYEIMRCEVGKDGEERYSWWNKKNGAEMSEEE